MVNIISCRTGMFREVELAFAMFPRADIFHAEVPPPADGDYQSLAGKAKAAGVTIATLATQLDLETDESAEQFRAVIDGAAAIGTPKIFVSAKAPESVPRDLAMARLRDICAYATEHKVTICMETHPPYGTNGDIARASIEDVGNAGLRFNFDTANIYYYNEGADTISELQKVKDLVASVHLKDTDGGYRSPNFPALGTGVVDFPTVFEILGKEQFSGPYTLEVEGAAVRDLDAEQRVGFLRQCTDYLKSIGAMA